MENNQLEQDTRTQWGLKKLPLNNKLKEERILETLTRIVTRIQNDERNCLRLNTLTRPARGCR